MTPVGPRINPKTVQTNQYHQKVQPTARTYTPPVMPKTNMPRTYTKTPADTSVRNKNWEKKNWQNNYSQNNSYKPAPQKKNWQNSNNPNTTLPNRNWRNNNNNQNTTVQKEELAEPEPTTTGTTTVGPKRAAAIIAIITTAIGGGAATAGSRSSAVGFTSGTAAIGTRPTVTIQAITPIPTTSRSMATMIWIPLR